MHVTQERGRTRKLHLHLTKRLDIKKEILEIGCGGGQNAIVLAKWGARSLGLDISEEQIEYATRLTRKHKVKVQFYVGNMESMDLFSNESFCNRIFREPWASVP